MDLRLDDNGTVLVTFPDFPEAVTFGEDESDALLRAVDALETVLAARIDEREDVPMPSPLADRPLAMLPALTAAKVLLYRAMRDAGVRKADLARRTDPRSTAWSTSIMPRVWIRSRQRWRRSASD